MKTVYVVQEKNAKGTWQDTETFVESFFCISALSEAIHVAGQKLLGFSRVVKRTEETVWESK